MKREDFQYLCELSTKLYGKKYYWKKFMSKGLVSKTNEGHLRRMPLTYQGCKQYMEKTLEQSEAKNAK